MAEQPRFTTPHWVGAAIGLCRTAALGEHQDYCLDCGHEEDPSYNSCRNRNCPKCQALAQQRWLNVRAWVLLNNKIKVLKRQAYGFRDMEFFKLRLYFLHETSVLLPG